MTTLDPAADRTAHSDAKADNTASAGHPAQAGGWASPGHPAPPAGPTTGARLSRRKPASRWWAETEIQVQFFDLDPMEIVWHGNYVKYLEVARCALLDSIDYNYVQMKASGFAWPIIDLQVRYVGAAQFGQRLVLRAEIVEWENRLKIDYLISCASSGKRLTRASTTQVAVDIASGEMCFASPPVLLQKLGVETP